MSQLTDVLCTLVFIFLVDCNQQSTTKGIVLSDICTQQTYFKKNLTFVVSFWMIVGDMSKQTFCQINANNITTQRMSQLTNVSMLVFSPLTLRFDPLMATSLVTASIPFGLFNLSFCDSSFFCASSLLRLSFIMTSVTFCCLPASGLFCK